MQFCLVKKYLFFIGLSLHAPAFANEPNDINPFEHARMFVNPDFSNQISLFFQKNKSYREKATNLELLDQHGNWNISTAIWLDSIQSIKGYNTQKKTSSMLDLLKMAAKSATQSSTVTITFVIYNLPGRDCWAYSSNGELPASTKGLDRYKNDYIGPKITAKHETTTIIDSLNAFYHDKTIKNQDAVNIVFILEPNSLPNLITNIHNQGTTCPSKAPYYPKGIKYALTQLSQFKDNGHPIFIYLDIAHSDSMGSSSQYSHFNRIYNHKTLGRGFDKIRGFITNTAHYAPEQEAFSYKQFLSHDAAIRHNPFYKSTDSYDEHTYIANLISYNPHIKTKPQITHPNQRHFLIDTSRNGWMTLIHHSADKHQKIYQYPRKDQRHHRANWCNIQSVQPLAAKDYINTTRSDNQPYEPGIITSIPLFTSSSGLGKRPTASPQVANPINPSEQLPLDAYVWIKPPYESDGSYDSNSFQGDQMCGDINGGSHNGNLPQDALQGRDNSPAPQAGQPFEQALMNLIDIACCVQHKCSSSFCSKPSSRD